MNAVRGDSRNYNTLSALFGFATYVVIVAVIIVYWDYIQFWIYVRYVHLLRLVEEIANHFSGNEIGIPNGNTREDSSFTIIIYLQE